VRVVSDFNVVRVVVVDVVIFVLLLIVGVSVSFFLSSGMSV
jgi:hypothetical protein